ncbi:MAG: efflux RND transporter permease subunit [Agarilytica sp.]
MKSPTLLDKLVTYSLSGGLPLLILALSLFAGAFALQLTPREEEPQIVVPMVDVLVEAPGLSAQQTARQVTIPLEKLLAQIPGVENVYSTSNTGKASVTLRFYVGENRETALLNTYNKLHSNQDRIPAVISHWLVKPVEVDDVPIVMLGLWSERPNEMSDFELRRIAEEISTQLQSIKNTSSVEIVGGRPRTIRILPQPESLSARQSTASDIVYALQKSNRLQSSGNWVLGGESVLLESGDFIHSLDALRQLVINVVDGNPVYLDDVATIIDGPAEPEHYTWIDFAETHPQFRRGDNKFPMVTISVAKQRGTNAVSVASAVHEKISTIQESYLPAGINVEVLRDYGQTANKKVSNLSSSLAFAIFTVVVFIAIFLGWRPALIVGLAVPISYGITLMLDMMFGYTINRVTLFALILSLGLLVDDPITGVDNIERFMRKTTGSAKDKIVAAISEIKTPLVMSTITIIIAFVPLAFISGMMGPYMAPMAFNVPVSVTASTVIAFLVTPWLARKILKFDEPVKEDSHTENTTPTETGLIKHYRKLMSPFLNDRKKASRVLWAVLVLFIAAALLPALRMVPLKLLPFDNKNEIQIIIDMPESSTLEDTASIATRVSQTARQLKEVQAVAAYIGTPSPIDFNGMVRRHYQRQAPNLADLRLKLVDKDDREHQSHGIVLRLRKLLESLNKNDINIKVVEVPPGPPVLSTLVAEIHGSEITTYEHMQTAAATLKQRLAREPFVTEIDTTVESEQKRFRFITDKQKAALSSVATEDINNTLLMANHGYIADYMQLDRETRPLPIELRLPKSERSNQNDLYRLHVKGLPGVVKRNTNTGLADAPQPLVALGELGKFEEHIADKAIHRKDLKPVVYVSAELSGRTPAEVIADIHADMGKDSGDANNWKNRTYLSSGGDDGWQLPEGIGVKWTGEGEWKITVDVFRDMGIAFIFALIGIFIVLKIQTSSTSLSLIIMSAIPLTIIGIMPGFWLLNQFGEREIAGAPDPILFTATAMIGMIALAGIVVRNSLILVEFITQARNHMSIKEALIQAGAVRLRPILLTAGTTLLGNLIITLDPVFSGLAYAIIFGIVASTIFTLLVVPIVYMLIFDKPSAPTDSAEPRHS